MARFRSRARGSGFGSFGGFGGGAAGLNASSLAPEDLFRLQQSLGQLQLGRDPREPSGGILGSISRGIGRVVPGSGIGSRTIEQIAEGLIYTPVGLFYLGKALGTDIGDIARLKPRGPLDLQTSDFLRDMGEAVYEDFRHPLRNPGYLALDLFTIASAGAGGVTRASRGANAVRALRPPETPLLPPGEGLPTRPTGPRSTPGAPPVVVEEVPSVYQQRERGLTREMRELVETDNPALADAIYERVAREKPNEVRFAASLEEVAPQGSPARARIQEHLRAAQLRGEQRRADILEQRRQEKMQAAPSALDVAMRGDLVPQQIPGQLMIPEFHQAFADVKPLSEARIRPQSGLAPENLAALKELTQGFLARGGTPTEAYALRERFMNPESPLPSDRERYRSVREMFALPEIQSLVHQMPAEDVYRQLASLLDEADPTALAKLRDTAEKASGLKATRQQLAREMTGAAKEVQQTSKLLEEVGFRPIQVPGVSERAAQARFVAKPYRWEGETAFRLYDSESSIETRAGTKMRDTGIVVRQAGERDIPTETVPVRGHPSRGTQKLFRVYDDGDPISDLISNPRDAVRLAQIHAAEKMAFEAEAPPIPEQALGLVRGDEPIGTLGPQAGELAAELGKREPILARDALEVGREQVQRRKASRKKAGVSRQASEDELAALLDDVDDTVAVGDINDVLGSPRTDVPGDTPIENTPPVSEEHIAYLKEEAPQEIAEDIDRFYEDMMEQSLAEEVRQTDERPIWEREAQPLREPTLRREGLSDRQLGINPRALDRAGLTREQGNQLREPLKEMREKYGSKMTDKDVRDVIEETLSVSPKEAERIFNDLRGAPKIAPGDIEMVKGSLLELFKRELDADQAAEASARWKERVTPYMKELRESGRAPKREDLLRMLSEEFGDDLGERMFGRLYRTKGGSGESAVSVFFHEFFKTPPRKQFLLSQPTVRAGTEKIFTPKYRTDPRTGELKRTVKTTTRKTLESDTEGVLIDLSRNPVRAGFQKWYYSWLQQAPEGGRRAKIRARKIKFEKDEIARTEKYLEQAGMTPEQLLEMRTATAAGATVGDYIDTMNQLAQIGVLYLKPAYLPPNLLGQILFTTIDHSWNPIAIARSFKMQREFLSHPEGREFLKQQRAGMGEGMYQSAAPERGASKKISRVHGALARGYGKVIDTPFRDASFFNEAWREGFTRPEQIIQLLKSQPGSELYNLKLKVFRNANRNIVDYGRLNKTEKILIRRAVFFYPWIKGSTIWAARTASEHPIQMTAMAQMGREGAERSEEILGEVPSYMQGIFPVGEREVPGLGKLPRVINPLSFSVTGSAGEFLNALRAFTIGGTQSEQLAEYFNPVLSAGLAGALRTDPFTGASYDQGDSFLSIVGQELTQNMPFMRMLRNIPGVPELTGLEPGKEGLVESGQVEAGDMLLPTTRMEELGRFLFGTSPVTYNVNEGQERAVAENLELRGTGEGATMRWEQRSKDSLAAAQAAGALRQGENFPDYVNEALQNQAQRDRMYELIKNEVGRQLTQVDRLRGDLQVIVQSGRMSEAQAMQLLLQYSNFDDTSVSYFRRKLADSYFGLPQLYAYRRQLESQGVDSSVLQKWDSPS